MDHTGQINSFQSRQRDHTQHREATRSFKQPVNECGCMGEFCKNRNNADSREFFAQAGEICFNNFIRDNGYFASGGSKVLNRREDSIDEDVSSESRCCDSW